MLLSQAYFTVSQTPTSVSADLDKLVVACWGQVQLG